MIEPPRKNRPIRSYVLRQGRLTPGQQRAFDDLWSRYGVDYLADSKLDFPALFGNNNPVYLEIGFGDGESLARIARDNPDRNYLGIEVHTPGVGHLLMQLDENDINNVRVMRHDAIEVLRDMIPVASLQGVQLFFPDPWHKKKHHKRRIVQPGFIALLAQVIRPGGVFHAATDWQAYAEHMMRILSAADDVFENTTEPGSFIKRPASRPLTKFEQRGERLGHGVWDLLFRRIG